LGGHAGRERPVLRPPAFWVVGRGWVPAQQIEVGDSLLGAVGERTVVESIEGSTESTVVYNLAIEEYHTYLVGATLWGFSVWVHNSNYPDAPSSQTAEDLATWVDEGGNLRNGGNPGMRLDAHAFQSGTPGARSNPLTGRSQVPYLEFTDEAGNVVGAKFDGVQGLEVIDRKLNPFFSAKAVDEAMRQSAVAQQYGLQAVWELPTQLAVDAANRFMRANSVTGILVRLAQ
jgi:Pretoxin HINT domain